MEERRRRGGLSEKTEGVVLFIVCHWKPVYSRYTTRRQENNFLVANLPKM